MSEKKLPQGISLRADGRYMWRFMYEGVKYTGYSRKLTEAKKAMADKRYEVEHGLSGKEKRVFLDAWFSEWMTVYKTGCKEVTLDRYRRMYNLYIKPKFGKMQLKNIRTDAVQKVLNDMAEQYSKGQVSTVHFLLSGCLEQAVRNGLISKNPCDNVVLPKCKRPKKKMALTVDQEQLFLEAAKDSYYYPLYRLSSLTGMRCGEIRGLQWDDIDFNKGIIHVRHTLSKTGDKGFYLADPKSESSRRDIPLGIEAHKLLKEQRKNQVQLKLWLGKRWKAKEGLDNLVFTSRSGGPVAPESISRTTKEIVGKLEETGVDMTGFTFHGLRHSFATRAIENGMNPKVLQGILGHSSFSITMDLYVDALESSKREEMEKLEAAL